MKMIFALLSLCTSSALAVTTVQQNLIPGASQHEVTGGLDLIATSSKDKSGYEGKFSGAMLAGSYYYGFAENQAVGVDLAATSTSGEYDNSSGTTHMDTKGLNDLQFRYKGNFDIGNPTLVVSGGFNLSPADKTLKDVGTNKYELNSASGAHSLFGRAGLIFPTSVINYGFIAQYTHQMDGKYKRESGNSYTADLKGGSSYGISALMELVNFLHPNFSLNYLRTFTSNAQGSTGSYETYPQESLGFTGSMRISVAEKIEILPYATLKTLLNKDENNLDTYGSVDLGATARFLF